ncbi:MAG: glycosyltransferase family 4 protein [Terriglobales bacterium]
MVEKLVECHGFSVTVIAPHRAAVEKVWSFSGFFTPNDAKLSIGDVRLVPLLNVNSPTDGFDPVELRRALRGVEPDAIWIQNEPADGMTRQILKHFFFRRKPKIACAVVENIWRRPPMIQRWKAWTLCQRIDVLLTCASLSAAATYDAFMPRRVRSSTVFLPHFDPITSWRGDFSIPRQPADFWIGFVGRICPEKGWRVLLDALLELPVNAKLVIAGDGPDAALLQEQIRSPELRSRAIFAGPLPAENVRALYLQVDAVAVPSLTTPKWKEQFGRVIAEAMAASLPVVGSDSGAIPEAIATAGIVVREGDPHELANALRCLMTDRGLRQKLSEAGRRRFETEFSIDAFASRLAGILAAG